MERRSFIKNIGAIAIISQIGITKALPKDSKEVVNDLILRSDKGEVKMKLLSIEQNFGNHNSLISARYDTIFIEAVVNESTLLDFSSNMEMIYEPHNSNTTLESHGYITDWKLCGDEVRFSFSVSGAMTIT